MSEIEDPATQFRIDARRALAYAARKYSDTKIGSEGYERYAALTNRLLNGEITIGNFEERLFEILSRRDNPHAAEVARETTNEVGRLVNRYRRLGEGGPKSEIEEIKERLRKLEEEVK